MQTVPTEEVKPTEEKAGPGEIQYAESKPTTFRTLHDRVLIKKNKPKKKIGLIEIPDSAVAPPDEGEVVAIGNKVFDAKVGDRVRFIKSAGTTVFVGGEERLILTEQDIYGILENGTLRPISSKVLILPDPPEEKIGLIELPKWVAKDAKARETLVSGKVVAMGRGMRTKKGGRWPMPDVKIGQHVLYFQNYAPEVIVEGVTYIVVADDQLRAVIEEDGNGQG